MLKNDIIKSLNINIVLLLMIFVFIFSLFFISFVCGQQHSDQCWKIQFNDNSDAQYPERHLLLFQTTLDFVKEFREEQAVESRSFLLPIAKEDFDNLVYLMGNYGARSLADDKEIVLESEIFVEKLQNILQSDRADTLYEKKKDEEAVLINEFKKDLKQKKIKNLYNIARAALLLQIPEKCVCALTENIHKKLKNFAQKMDDKNQIETLCNATRSQDIICSFKKFSESMDQSFKTLSDQALGYIFDSENIIDKIVCRDLPPVLCDEYIVFKALKACNFASILRLDLSGNALRAISIASLIEKLPNAFAINLKKNNIQTICPEDIQALSESKIFRAIDLRENDIKIPLECRGDINPIDMTELGISLLIFDRRSLNKFRTKHLFIWPTDAEKKSETFALWYGNPASEEHITFASFNSEINNKTENIDLTDCTYPESLAIIVGTSTFFFPDKFEKNYLCLRVKDFKQINDDFIPQFYPNLRKLIIKKDLNQILFQVDFKKKAHVDIEKTFQVHFEEKPYDNFFPTLEDDLFIHQDQSHDQYNFFQGKFWAPFNFIEQKFAWFKRQTALIIGLWVHVKKEATRFDSLFSFLFSK